jgi:two-component system chemotaxis response regulator CheB
VPGRSGDPERGPAAASEPAGGRPPTPRLVVVGGSAGALEPLTEIVAGLPADLPATVLVALHVAPGTPSALPRVLDRAGPLPARHPRSGEALRPGQILVAPPDHHLVVRDDAVHLSRGPRENRHRPAIDALFNSAARWHGPAVVAVVLSGALDDGAAGAAAIAAQEGAVIVQDPAEARVSGMPQAALTMVRRARTVPAGRIAPLLVDLTRRPGVHSSEPASALLDWEDANMTAGPDTSHDRPPGAPAALGCPECQGGMFETTAGSGGLHYLCHVGHSWSPETLINAQREASEGALYNAASKLLEEAAVLERVAAHLAESGETPADEPAELRRRAEYARKRANRIQELARED